MNTLVKLTYGSNLYGTAVPGSDQDYRGVYLPSRDDCFLNRVKDTITDGSEEDTQYFSLQYFLQLACQGQSIAIEMLASTQTETKTPLWDVLRANRKRFYTKSIHSFLGFAKSMASKYSARVDRLSETNEILIVLLDHLNWPHNPTVSRLGSIWDKLPVSPNAIKTANDRSSGADQRVYQVCGRELQATVTIQHAYTTIKAVYDSYGERVRAAKDGRIDWKALMHAYRVALQAKEIVETGDLVYPLKDAAYLRPMRLGQIPFIENALDQRLDDLIAEVQVKMDASALPAKADTAWCDAFVLEAYGT